MLVFEVGVTLGAGDQVMTGAGTPVALQKSERLLPKFASTVSLALGKVIAVGSTIRATKYKTFNRSVLYRLFSEMQVSTKCDKT